MTKRPILYLLDGSSYIYRAFFALPHLSSASGLPTNASLGFTNMLLKMLKDKSPEYMAVIFDAKGPTFRHELYESYKITRPPMPYNLSSQIPYIKEIVEGLNISMLELEGYEADDIIATICKEMENKEYKVIVITGDKDLFQLVSKNVTLWDSMKNKVSGIVEVKERFEIEPHQIPDVMGLTGDSIDNVPGIPGIGEKTAIRLIKEFQSIENLLDNIDQIPKEKLKANLRRYKDQALLSKELVTLKSDVPVACDLKHLKVKSPDRAKLRKLFKELEFTRLLREIELEESQDSLKFKPGNDAQFG